MDSNSAQDVVRCTLCQTSVAPMYCEVCHIHLCKDFVEKHFSDSSKVHNVVPLKQYCTTLRYPKCRKHPTKQCELHCEQCDIPICVQCISSGKHLGHKQIDISKTLEYWKENLQNDLEELEKIIYPKYQEIASIIPVQKANLIRNSQKLTTAINKRGEVWHREIDDIIRNLKSEVEEMESKNVVVLKKQEDEIKHTISEITHIIDELKKLLNSKDVCLVSEYKSRIAEFSRVPPKLKVSFSNFKPQEINREHLLKQFGSLSAVSITHEEPTYYNIMPTQGAKSSPKDLSLTDVPRVITAIDTGYEYLNSVACLNDTEIWTCGSKSIMKLFSLQGELKKSVLTKSMNMPQNIAVTGSGELVYSDEDDKTVNIVKNTRVNAVITLRAWGPLGICKTLSGDLLVIMNSADKQSRVVRYSGSKPKNVIQFNNKNQPLFSTGDIKYISENRNLDICVSDKEAGAVVVVNQAGKLRFTYTGPSSTAKQSFDPVGITTDSHSQILTADIDNNLIHILDQDGRFLRYIDNCDLQNPLGLCVDTRDNLFVAEYRGKVKKIQYYM